jgi:hypothetical protein
MRQTRAMEIYPLYLIYILIQCFISFIIFVKQSLQKMLIKEGFTFLLNKNVLRNQMGW